MSRGSFKWHNGFPIFLGIKFWWKSMVTFFLGFPNNALLGLVNIMTPDLVGCIFVWPAQVASVICLSREDAWRCTFILFVICGFVMPNPCLLVSAVSIGVGWPWCECWTCNSKPLWHEAQNVAMWHMLHMFGEMVHYGGSWQNIQSVLCRYIVSSNWILWVVCFTVLLGGAWTHCSRVFLFHCQCLCKIIVLGHIYIYNIIYNQNISCCTPLLPRKCSRCPIPKNRTPPKRTSNFQQDPFTQTHLSFVNPQSLNKKASSSYVCRRFFSLHFQGV